MRARSWTLSRTASQRAIVAALVCITAATAFLLAAIVSYNDRAQAVGIRDYLAGVDATAGSVQVQAALADDPAKQQQAAADLFARQFAGLPLTVYRSVTLAPVTVTDAVTTSREAGTVRLGTFDAAPEHARLVAGDWPDFATTTAGADGWPAALQADAAEALGLSVGDTLKTGSLTASIRAIWTPVAANDPYFAADAAAARSADALAADRAALGFLIVGDDALTAAKGSPLVNFTVVPTRGDVLPTDLQAMSQAVAGLPAKMATVQSGAVAAGGLARTLQVVIASVVAASAVGAIPALTIAAISLVMLVQLARLLALQRRAETALVRSRGASVGRLARIAITEALYIAVPAVAVALGGAVLVSRYLGLPLPAAGWASAIAVGVAAAAIIVIPAVHQARLPANRQLIDDSGRIRGVVASGTVALLCVIAAVAWWRLEQVGSAVAVAADGTVRLDPIAVIAPAAVLVALSMVAWVVFAVLSEAWEWSTRARGAAGAWLVSRTLARRATVFGIIVVLIAIAFGSVGMAAVYAPTQRGAQQQANILGNGANIRVTVPAADPLRAGEYRPSSAAVIAGALDSDRVISALQRQVTVGETDVLLTGVPLPKTRAANTTLPVIAGSFDPPALAATLGGGAPGLPLPADTAELSLDVSIGLAWHKPGPTTSHSDGPLTQEPGGPGPSGLTARLGVTAWVQDANGVVTPVSTSTLPAVPVAPESPTAPMDATLTVALPALAAESSLIAIDLSTPNAAYPMDIDFALRGVTSSGGAALDPSSVTWAVSPQPRVTNSGAQQLLDYALAPAGASMSGTVPAGQITQARLTVSSTAPLPVAINPPLAQALELSAGDTVDVAIDGGRKITVRIATVSPLLPGSADQPAMLADLGALDQAMLASIAYLPGVNQVWTADDAPGTAARIRPVVAATAAITAADTLSIGALADPAGVTLWIGAVGALLLATVGVGSVMAGLARARRGEAVVLRASGISARRQARLRRIELGVTLVAAWLLGVAVAAGGVLLTARTLAGSAVVGLHGAQPPLRISALAAAIVIGAHILLLIAAVAVHSRRLRVAARRATPTELVT